MDGWMDGWMDRWMDGWMDVEGCTARLLHELALTKSTNAGMILLSWCATSI